jgi:hypothetical protein
MNTIDISLCLKLFLVIQIFYVIYKVHSIERKINASFNEEKMLSGEDPSCEPCDNSCDVVDVDDFVEGVEDNIEIENTIPQGIFEEQEIVIHRENEFERMSLGELKRLADEMEICYKKNCKKSTLIELIQEKKILSKDI